MTDMIDDYWRSKIAEIEKLVAENARLRALLAAAAPELRLGSGGSRYCAMCRAYDNHAADCLVALIEKALK